MVGRAGFEPACEQSEVVDSKAPEQVEQAEGTTCGTTNCSDLIAELRQAAEQALAVSAHMPADLKSLLKKLLGA